MNYDQTVDIWSLGCVLYEIVVGQPPFVSYDEGRDIRKFEREITEEEVKMKDWFSRDFSNLLEGLLDKNPKTRLTLDKVKKHKFFAKTNFDDIFNKKMKPPIKPTVKSEEDLRNFDKKILQENVFEGSPSH